MLVILLRCSDKKTGRDLPNATQHRRGEPESHHIYLPQRDPSLSALTFCPPRSFGEGGVTSSLYMPPSKESCEAFEGISWPRGGALKMGVVPALTRAPPCLLSPGPCSAGIPQFSMEFRWILWASHSRQMEKKNIPLEPCSALRI